MLNTVVSGLSANSGSLGFCSWNRGEGGSEGLFLICSYWKQAGVDLPLPRPVVPLLVPMSTIYLSLYITLDINDNYKNVTS